MANKSQNVAQAIASACVARRNCERSGNATWREAWAVRVNDLTIDCLPHGSGFDARPAVDMDTSDDARIVVRGEFHQMDAHGSYCGWRSFTVTARPTFTGIDVRVVGAGGELNDYIADVYAEALRADAPEFSPA